ncbi:MAG: hypothetical protein EOM22_14140 [Gammaproteobacteria bacterium]|nr:hypothetical protein [Gammaproteobacteria bacterium]
MRDPKTAATEGLTDTRLAPLTRRKPTPRRVTSDPSTQEDVIVSPVAITVAQSIGIKIVAALAQQFFVSGGLYERIGALVKDAESRLSAPGTGTEKKAWVMHRLDEEAGWLIEEIRKIPGWLLSMVVDIVVGRLKVDGKL